MFEIVNEIKYKIKEYKGIYINNEMAVRAQLVDPILNALGWLTTDPSLVIMNATTDDKEIPDYTLLRNKRVETYIEAKNLSKNIEDSLPQLARYCINNGKEFGIITNGNNWLLIKTFEKDTKPKDRIIWQISIEVDSVATVIKRLRTISKDQIENLPLLIENEKKLQKFWEEYLSNQDSFLDKISKEIASEFILKYSFDSNEEGVESFFKEKLQGLLTEKAISEIHKVAKEPVLKAKFKKADRPIDSFQSQPKFNKNGSPNVEDWVQANPELNKIKGLNNWKAICDYLDIKVDGDSARRRLKKWAEINKPNWIPIPEPIK